MGVFPLSVLFNPAIKRASLFRPFSSYISSVAFLWVKFIILRFFLFLSPFVYYELKSSKMGPDIPQGTKGGTLMTLKEAITLFGYHQRSNLRAKTVRSYQPLLQKLGVQFEERSFESMGSDEIFQFL